MRQVSAIRRWTVTVEVAALGLAISDLQKYSDEVKRFEFRDLRLSKIDRATKLPHLVASAFDLNVTLWYGFWVTIVVYADWRLP